MTAGTAAPTANASSGSGSTPRTVQETDLYRVDGNRLYYLDGYRGLMVFDITNPDAPKLLGRSAIFGDPQEMFVQNGIAVIVVADWYGAAPGGVPFHGSIVRGLDATDPTNIKVVGEAQLGGYVQDTRVVGNVLYAVVEDYGWEYGWGGGYYPGYATNPTPKVGIASVSFANGVVTPVANQTFNGTGGVFNVTANSILLAFQDTQQSNAPYGTPGQTDLQYVDISDPGGAIRLRGTITVNGSVNGWGPDNGRWNLDFADGATAHAIGCSAQYYCGNSNDTYTLSTVDFTNPDAPAIVSELPISNLGWSAAARFSGTTLYLSPSDNYSATTNSTPLSIYDLSQPAAPTLAGTTTIPGSIWMYLPDGTKLFSIGSVYNSTPNTSSSQVSVDYIDVSNPSNPQFIGTSTFGQGWAWTPAAQTFKAFTINDSLGLAVIPFSGWDYTGQAYTNGVQLVQYTPTALVGGAAAQTKGWVERGIFANGRLYSLSDQSLGVVDYSNPASPRVVTELTLARNVVNAQPQGATIAELSSDWWGNDVSATEMRVLPIANAAETTDSQQAAVANIAGVGAQVFTNGTLSYVVTIVQEPVQCPAPGTPYQYNSPITGPNGQCYVYSQQVQVVDTSNGGAKLRGSIVLPGYPTGWYGWGWCCFDDYGWYGGQDVVQVGGDALAFRRWYPQYAYTGNGYQYVDSLDDLFVVDLSNPDAPSVASTVVTADPTTWWGNLQAVGDTLYATHYEWVETPTPGVYGTQWYVRYYLDTIDLSDRAHPQIGSKVNIPGIFVGASSTDPSTIYTIDYRWDDATTNNLYNSLDVLKLDGGLAYLQSQTKLDGWVGNVIVQGNTLYTTAQQYYWAVNGQPPIVELHQIDLTNPQQPVDRIATQGGWGWLLGVVGDRAVVTSGWGEMGVDIYHLSATAAPSFEQTVRTLGWWTNSITRQDNTLYLTSGYWGVQPVVLQ
jgi:hypothetical protein